MGRKFTNPAGHRRVPLQGWPSRAPRTKPAEEFRGWKSIPIEVERELEAAIAEETAAGEARRGRPTPTLRQEAELIDEDAIRLEMERRLEKRFAR